MREEAGASCPTRSFRLRHSAEGIWLTAAVSESSLLRKTPIKVTRPKNKLRKSKDTTLKDTSSPYEKQSGVSAVG